MPLRYDTVVIGSGAAGMTAAIALAREGKKTLVVEQNHIPGGLMQLYFRAGCRFPTGVHLLGSLKPGQPLWQYFKYLGVLDRIRLVPMDADAFQHFDFQDEPFRMPTGHAAAMDRLCEHFPNERAAIYQYFQDMQATVKQFALYMLDSNTDPPSSWTDTTSLKTYVAGLTDCPRLQAVLQASNPLYGLDSSSCPPYIHFLVNDSFISGSWRVDESHISLAHAFVDALKSFGGQLRCRAKVKSIQCDQGRISAVELDDGEVIATENVIFTGHPRGLRPLCPDNSLRPAYCNRIDGLSDSKSAFGLAIAWRHPDCPPAKRDYFFYHSWDTDAHYGQQLLTDQASPYMLYCSALPEAPHGTWSVTALCVADYNEWSQWDSSDPRDRPDAYEAAKEQISERILNRLKQQWPDAADGMTLASTYTPLTIGQYTLAPKGTAYGIRKTTQDGRAALLSARTRIKGLYLAGQSVILPGILGAVISGINAGSAIVGRKYLIDRIVKDAQ